MEFKILVPLQRVETRSDERETRRAGLLLHLLPLTTGRLNGYLPSCAPSMSRWTMRQREPLGGRSIFLVMVFTKPNRVLPRDIRKPHDAKFWTVSPGTEPPTLRGGQSSPVVASNPSRLRESAVWLKPTYSEESSHVHRAIRPRTRRLDPPRSLAPRAARKRSSPNRRFATATFLACSAH